MKVIFKKSLIIFLILCSSRIGNSAVKRIGPITIADLVNYSEKIYLGQFIKAENKYFYFAVNDISSKCDQKDTIKIPDNSEDFDTIQNRSYRSEFRFLDGKNKLKSIEDNENLIRIQEAEELVLFVFKDQKIPFYFLTKNGKIYREGYDDRIDKRNFYNIKKERSWEEQISIIQSVKKRIDEIKNIHNINDDKNRNRSLFRWIKKNKKSLNQNRNWDNSNDDYGWSTINREVFKWVTEARIAKDTWKSAKLFREIMVKDEDDDSFLYDYGDSSFNSYKSVKFLVKVASNSKRKKSERIQALIFLKSTNLKYASTLKTEDKELFNKLIKLYRVEYPSRLKNELIEFIYAITNKYEWHNILGNQNRILVQLHLCYKDNDEENLCIQAYNYGIGTIENKSVNLTLEKIDNNGKPMGENIMFSFDNFEVPFKEHNSNVKELNYSETPKGNWKIYIHEGVNKDFVKWKSEYIIIKK